MVQLTEPPRAPRVSAILIFLNERRFLAEAIESVRAQTMADWELILVDDGSTDGSSQIAQDAAAGDQRVRYLTHPGHENRGMSASRNRGIAAARGEFIAFIDGDDAWLPTKLAEQLAIFEAVPEAEMIYGRTLIWYSWQADAAKRDFCYDLGVSPNALYRAPRLFPVLVHNRAQTPTTINAIMRRSLVERVGGFEDSFRGMFEDQVFFAKTHLTAACYVDDRIWARYRQHEASCSARSAGTEADLRAREIFLDWLGRYVRAQRCRREGVRASLIQARGELRRQQARWHLRKLLRGLRRFLLRPGRPMRKISPSRGAE